MDISVLVCTKNRCERLPAFIEGLKALDFSSVEAELILIDNGSSDDTAAMLTKLADASPFARTSVLSAAGPLSAAKNTALQHAEGDITIFTDDDCFPDPDWLLQMKRFFNEHSEAHAAGGHVRLYDLKDYPMTITFEHSVSPKMGAGTALWASVHGCNLAFRRQSLISVGGFDERLGPGTPAKASEDRDALYRVARAHGGFYYVDSARLRHHHGRRGHDIGPLLSSYKLGEEAFWYKYAARGDWRVLRMVAKITSWKFDRERMSRPALLARVVLAMVGGYFRGRRAYNAYPEGGATSPAARG